MDLEKSESSLVKSLPTTAEYIIATNIDFPIKILGVATIKIRDTKTSPWRDGYLAIYEEYNTVKKAEINHELYSALHLVFDVLNNMEERDIDIN